ncbi:hypothetical protein FCMLKIFP_00067 [Pseudomonas phage Ka3]|nr:hypothetical protein FCMLKIFP_00067 [Pseudomonas phage Ka3]
MDAKLLKEAIRAGMEMALKTGKLNSMCIHVSAQAWSGGVLTVAHSNEFRRWIYKTLGNYCYVSDYLRSCHPRYLWWGGRNMWCNFYVWAYYDLCKEQNHETHS